MIWTGRAGAPEVAAGRAGVIQAGPGVLQARGSFANPGGFYRFSVILGLIIYECKLFIFSDLYPKNACYTIYIMLCNVLIFR